MYINKTFLQYIKIIMHKLKAVASLNKYCVTYSQTARTVNNATTVTTFVTVLY